MDPAFLIPVSAFAMVAAIVWVVQAYTSRNRKAFFETVRAAFERGTELSPEMIKTLGAPRHSKYADIKWGVIWIATALAFVLCGWVLPENEDFESLQVFSAIAAFPGLVGLALLGYGLAMLRVKE